MVQMLAEIFKKQTLFWLCNIWQFFFKLIKHLVTSIKTECYCFVNSLIFSTSFTVHSTDDSLGCCREVIIVGYMGDSWINFSYIMLITWWNVWVASPWRMSMIEDIYFHGREKIKYWSDCGRALSIGNVGWDLENGKIIFTRTVP